jgi:ribosomal protein L37AE/L43A
MQRKQLNRLAARSATAVRQAFARIQRPKTLAVFCEHCQTLVKARRYNPILFCCNKCTDGVAAGNLSQWRTSQQAAELAHHLHVKRTRQWRRQAAQVTAARSRPQITGTG